MNWKPWLYSLISAGIGGWCKQDVIRCIVEALNE
jgi:hypothetical protein